MDLHTWIKAKSGRGQQVAQACGVGKAAVSHWHTSGVPAEHMRTIEALTRGAVSIKDMALHRVEIVEARNSESTTDPATEGGAA
jgi:DNA-binding transcriptional regulator YdaS (Cro superfamily)